MAAIYVQSWGWVYNVFHKFFSKMELVMETYMVDIFYGGWGGLVVGDGGVIMWGVL